MEEPIHIVHAAKETVREFMKHQFDLALNENMMKGFTPFPFKRWTNHMRLTWTSWKYHEGASNLSVSDLSSRDSALNLHQSKILLNSWQLY